MNSSTRRSIASSLISVTPPGNRLSRTGLACAASGSEAIPGVRAREAARVRELETEIEVAVAIRAEALAVRGDELVAERASDGSLRSDMRSWLGLARPSCRTAAASPPQTSLAPLAPKRCQRRRGRIARLAVVVPSHPSIGRTQKRLPTHGAIDERLSKRRLRRRRRIVETEVDSGRFEVTP